MDSGELPNERKPERKPVLVILHYENLRRMINKDGRIAAFQRSGNTTGYTTEP